MNDCPVGVFDSGVGGLTVLAELKNLLPCEKFIYFGDTLNVPYGTKTPEELEFFVDKIMNFFIEKNVKAVVIACNTVSAVLYGKMLTKYNIPIYPVLQTSVKLIASSVKANSIGVLATETTVKSHAYKKEIEKLMPGTKVFEHACPGRWVEIAEENAPINDENRKIIFEHLNEILKHNPEKILSGCTHYPYLTRFFELFADKEIFLNPAVYCAKFVAKDLKNKNLLSDKDFAADEFYVSSNPEKFQKSAQLFYNLKEKPLLKIL